MAKWKTYSNYHELSDGRTLTIRYGSIYYGPSDPDNETSDIRFTLDGDEIHQQDLPEEMTDALIQELIDDAKEVNDEY